MNTMTNAAPEREEIEQLLPWHAAGTLSRRDAQRVEEALRSDPELARQFELVREELSETIHLNETLGAPSARAMSKLMANIEAEAGPAKAVQPRLSFSTWLAERLSALSPRTLAYGTTAAALALFLQFGVLTGVAVNTALKPSGGYETASGPGTTRSASAGSFVLVGFQPGVTIGQINAVLEKHSLTIVDGPRAGGIYRVRIAARALPAAERDQVIERVRAEASVIVFVAPTE